jgi:hypothetical protein
MPSPKNEREVKRFNRELSGALRDKDRARRSRRLAGAAPIGRKPAKKTRPELEDDWQDEIDDAGDEGP